MAQIRIEDDVYNKLKEAAEFNKRTVGQHIAFLLDNEITFSEIRGMLAGQAPVTPVAPALKVTPVAEVKPVVATTPSFPNGIDWEKIESEVLNPDAQKKFQKQLKEAKKRESERGEVVGDLTEKDLATAKVTFEERPDFKEPEKWDKHAWPTV